MNNRLLIVNALLDHFKFDTDLKLDTNSVLLRMEAGFAMVDVDPHEARIHLKAVFDYVVDRKYVQQEISRDFHAVCMALFKLESERSDQAGVYLEAAISTFSTIYRKSGEKGYLEMILYAAEVYVGDKPFLTARVSVEEIEQLLHEVSRELVRLSTKDYMTEAYYFKTYFRFNLTKMRFYAKVPGMIEICEKPISECLKFLMAGAAEDVETSRLKIEVWLTHARLMEVARAIPHAYSLYTQAYEESLKLLSKNEIVYCGDVIEVGYHFGLFCSKFANWERVSDVSLFCVSLFKFYKHHAGLPGYRMVQIWQNLARAYKETNQLDLAEAYLTDAFQFLMREDYEWRSNGRIFLVLNALTEIDLAKNDKKKAADRYQMMYAFSTKHEKLKLTHFVHANILFGIYKALGFSEDRVSARLVDIVYLYCREFHIAISPRLRRKIHSRMEETYDGHSVRNQWTFLNDVVGQLVSKYTLDGEFDLVFDLYEILLDQQKERGNWSMLYATRLKAAEHAVFVENLKYAVLQFAEARLLLFAHPDELEMLKEYEYDLKMVCKTFRLDEKDIRKKIDEIIYDLRNDKVRKDW